MTGSVTARQGRKLSMKSAVSDICSRLPMKPVYTASKVTPQSRQWAAVGAIWPVRSRNVFPVKPPVWVER